MGLTLDKLPFNILGEIMNHLAFPSGPPESPTIQDAFVEVFSGRPRLPDNLEEKHWFQQDALSLAASCKTLRAQLMPLLWETVQIVVIENNPPNPLTVYHTVANEKSRLDYRPLFVLNCLWQDNKPSDFYNLNLKKKKSSAIWKSMLKSKQSASPMESALSYIKVLKLYAYTDPDSRRSFGIPKNAVEKFISVMNLIEPKSMPRLQLLEIEMLLGPDFPKPQNKLMKSLKEYSTPVRVELVLSEEYANLFPDLLSG